MYKECKDVLCLQVQRGRCPYGITGEPSVCVCVYHGCVLHLTADGTWPQGASASMALG